LANRNLKETDSRTHAAEETAPRLVLERFIGHDKSSHHVASPNSRIGRFATTAFATKLDCTDRHVAKCHTSGSISTPGCEKKALEGPHLSRRRRHAPCGPLRSRCATRSAHPIFCCLSLAPRTAAFGWPRSSSRDGGAEPMQTKGRFMRTRVIVALFSLLVTASPGLSHLCIADCSERGEYDRSLREAHSSCDTLRLCGRSECCLNGQSALPGTVTRKVVAPHPWPDAVGDSALFRVTRSSQRIAQTRPPSSEASTSHLYSLHCAFLI
jgi:hypothetical protein